MLGFNTSITYSEAYRYVILMHCEQCVYDVSCTLAQVRFFHYFLFSLLN